LPEFSIEFRDDYKIKSVEYRLNFHGINEWTKINSNDINNQRYTGNWDISQTDWEYMVENENYYIYFKLTDSLENQYITPSIDKAMKIIKDFNISETTPYDPDLSDFEEWHWNNVFTITVDIADDDITNLKIQYSFSTDNKKWSEWKQHGENLTTSPFEWNFTAKEGSGYYKFKTIVLTNSGNIIESQVKFVNVTLFPMIPIIAMISLAFILIITTSLVLGFNPFRLKKKKN